MPRPLRHKPLVTPSMPSSGASPPATRLFWVFVAQAARPGTGTVPGVEDLRRGVGYGDVIQAFLGHGVVTREARKGTVWDRVPCMVAFESSSIQFRGH